MVTTKKRRDYEKRRRQAFKRKAFALLGNECKHCGEKDHRVLQVDHIDGAPEKLREYGRAGSSLYFQIATGKKPLHWFQLLCANCNWRKRHEKSEHTAAHKQRSPYDDSGTPSKGAPEEHT